MGLLSWLTGIGLPSLVGFACFAGAIAAWFRVPVLGHYIGLGLAMIGVGFLAHASGYSAAREACQEAAVRSELAQAKQDLAISQEAAKQAQQLGERLAASEARNMEIVNELANRPVPDSCRLSGDDIKRLLGIR
jgi:hypothetical protein